MYHCFYVQNQYWKSCIFQRKSYSTFNFVPVNSCRFFIDSNISRSIIQFGLNDTVAETISVSFPYIIRVPELLSSFLALPWDSVCTYLLRTTVCHADCALRGLRDLLGCKFVNNLFNFYCIVFTNALSPVSLRLVGYL